MSNKYTPGPWHFDWTTKVNGVIQGWAVGPADKPLDEVDHIDPVVWLDNDTENAEANARLIAAAPELLEALKVASDAIASGDQVQLHCAEDQINDAIAKATQDSEGDE